VQREHVALAGAGVVTWSKYTQFEANTLPFLTVMTIADQIRLDDLVKRLWVRVRA